MFHNFNSRPLAFREAPAPTPAEQAKALLRRYPNLSEVELARLIAVYRELPAVDMALMLSDEQLAPSMDRFAADHRSRLRTPFRHYAALVAYALLTMIGIAWAASFAS